MNDNKDIKNPELSDSVKQREKEIDEALKESQPIAIEDIGKEEAPKDKVEDKVEAPVDVEAPKEEAVPKEVDELKSIPNIVKDVSTDLKTIKAVDDIEMLVDEDMVVQDTSPIEPAEAMDDGQLSKYLITHNKDSLLYPTVEYKSITLTTPILTEQKLLNPTQFTDILQKDDSLIDSTLILPCEDSASIEAYFDNPILKQGATDQMPNPGATKNLTREEEYTFSTLTSEGIDIINIGLHEVKDDPTKKYTQGVDIDDLNLNVVKVKAGSMEGTVLAGTSATIAIKSAIGGGLPIRIPLFHTGVWHTFMAPTRMELYSLYNSIVTSVSLTATETSGMTQSNLPAVYTDSILRFYFDRLIDDGTKKNDKDRSKVSSLDLNLILAGMLTAIFPKGYDYARTVLVGETSREVIESGKISFAKTIFTDQNALTEYQKKQMYRLRSSGEAATDQELEKYRLDFNKMAITRLKLNDFLAIDMKVPSLEDYVSVGLAYITDLETEIGTLMTQDLSKEARIKELHILLSATSARQRAQWVNKIYIKATVDGDEKEIIDRESIDKNVSLFTENRELLKIFEEGINKYSDDATISIMGIPGYSYHTWKGEDTAETKVNIPNPHPKHPKIVPIDPRPLFFTLLEQNIRTDLRNY